MKINKKTPSSEDDIKNFINNIDFKLPIDFIDFYTESNGAEILTDDGYYIFLWAINEMIQLNIEYSVTDYAPNYFFIGSDGGDMAYCIEKATGNIFEMPFIGMSNDEAIFKCKLITNLFF